MENPKHREQVADLILKSPEGKDLVIASELVVTFKRWFTFEVADLDNTERYRVTIKIEEV